MSAPPPLPVHTPTVLVTGAARRTGRRRTLQLAASGWRVAVHYRDSVEDATKTVADCARLTGGAAAFRCNLGNETAVRNLLPAVIEKMGHVDAIVNSASTFEHDTARTFTFAAMEKHLRSNAGATILLSEALHHHCQPPANPRSDAAEGQQHRRAVPRVGPRGQRPAQQWSVGQGVVVNLLDQKLWNQNPDFMSYTLSKAALEAANTMLALALSPLVRVVGVAPGLTLTSHMLSQEKFDALHRLSPLGRSSTPQDVAATVEFALENQSITGTTLLVDGGQHLMRFERDFSLM